jgi:hypothetical protein
MANPEIREVKDIIKDKHVDYKENIKDWELYGDAVSGAGGFKKGGYIDKFKSEDQEKYERRQKQVYYLNHTAAVIDTYVGHLYKKPVSREHESDALEKFYASTNIEGDRTIEEYMQMISAASMTYGVCYAVVDRTRMDGEQVRSKADLERLGAKTYSYILTPKDIINWALGPDGLFNWVIIQETNTTNPDHWMKAHKKEVRYRVWTREYWALYREGENNPYLSAEHELGVVPIVPVFNVIKEGHTVIGRSEIAEIAKINKNLYNKCSELDELMVNNAFAILAMSKKNVDQTNFKLGAGRVLFFDEIMPQYISPSPMAIAAYETRIQNLVNEIYRIAKIEYTGGVAPSGIALAFKFEKTNQSLARKASNLEDAEMKLAKMVSRWESIEEANALELKVEYPRDYGIIDFQGEAMKDEKVLDIGISPTFNKIYKKGLVEKYKPSATTEEKKKIYDEIDAEEAPTDFTGEEEVDEEINGEESTNEGGSEGESSET